MVPLFFKKRGGKALNCALREEPVPYQLVGGVKAHQGDDG